MLEPRSSPSGFRRRLTAFARTDGAVDIADDDWLLMIDELSAARIYRARRSPRWAMVLGCPGRHWSSPIQQRDGQQCTGGVGKRARLAKRSCERWETVKRRSWPFPPVSICLRAEPLARKDIMTTVADNGAAERDLRGAASEDEGLGNAGTPSGKFCASRLIQIGSRYSPSKPRDGRLHRSICRRRHRYPGRPRPDAYRAKTQSIALHSGKRNLSSMIITT